MDQAPTPGHQTQAPLCRCRHPKRTHMPDPPHVCVGQGCFGRCPCPGFVPQGESSQVDTDQTTQ